MSSATAMINKATNIDPTDQAGMLWKGIIYYYYVHSKCTFFDTPMLSQQKQEETLKVLLPIIKQCEAALLGVQQSEFFVLARFIALKFFLLLQVQRFGCGLIYKSRTYDLMDIAN